MDNFKDGSESDDYKYKYNTDTCIIKQQLIKQQRFNWRQHTNIEYYIVRIPWHKCENGQAYWILNYCFTRKTCKFLKSWWKWLIHFLNNHFYNYLKSDIFLLFFDCWKILYLHDIHAGHRNTPTSLSMFLHIYLLCYFMFTLATGIPSIIFNKCSMFLYNEVFICMICTLATLKDVVGVYISIVSNLKYHFPYFRFSLFLYFRNSFYIFNLLC